MKGVSMKRVFVFALLAGLVLAIPMSHVFAAKEAKVEICHVNSANSAGSYTHVGSSMTDYTDLNPNDGTDYNQYDYSNEYDYTVTYNLGRVIEVAASAVDAHVAHGDSTVWYELTENAADYFTSMDDLDGSDSYDYSGTYAGYYSWVSHSEYTRDGTSAVIKNANCYMYNYQDN